MAFFKTAQAEIEQRFTAPAGELRRAMEQALSCVGAKAIAWSPDGVVVTAKVALNFWSWGEKLVASLRETGAVHVHSKCAFPLQAFDWGKNFRNCQAFLNEVEMCLSGRERYVCPAAGREIGESFFEEPVWCFAL